MDYNIKFDEEYINSDYGTDTYYFTADKGMLNIFHGNYDFSEAVSAEISIELPHNSLDAKDADVCISPTREIDGMLEDYDWHDVELSYEEVEELISLILLID